MNTGFQFFEGASTESAEVAKITVRRGGVLVLTGAAVRMLGEDVTHVQVGFNPDTRAVGLRRAASDSKGSYRLRLQRGGVSRLVDGKRVFSHHGLKAEAAGSFPVQDFGDGVVGFVLPAVAAAPAPASAPAPAPAKAKPGTR